MGGRDSIVGLHATSETKASEAAYLITRARASGGQKTQRRQKPAASSLRGEPASECTALLLSVRRVGRILCWLSLRVVVPFNTPLLAFAPLSAHISDLKAQVSALENKLYSAEAASRQQAILFEKRLSELEAKTIASNQSIVNGLVSDMATKVAQVESSMLGCSHRVDSLADLVDKHLFSKGKKGEKPASERASEAKRSD